jgi:HK97 family phage major capsid protein
MDVENWLSMKIADIMSHIENASFVNGEGTGKPHGIFTYMGRHYKSGRSSANQ